MNASLLALLTAPVALTGGQRLVLMLPLCLSIALVYKTTRVEELRGLPASVAALWITIVLGMGAVGVGLWVLFRFLV